MAISKYIEWLFVFMILRHDCSAYNISSEICLETPFGFALGDIGCGFTLTTAKDWLESDTGMCPQKCLVKINNLKGRWTYQLTSIVLSISGLREDLKTIETRCNNIFAFDRTLEIICKTDAENADISKDLCSPTKECKDVSKACLLTGQVGVCICKPEYIGFENECLKGNLKLNETCKRNEQCSVAFGSVCRNERCVCRGGYVPFNDSKCLLLHAGGNSEASVQNPEEDNVVSVTVGSLFGGLILGIILTVLTMTIYHRIRHGKPNTKEREFPKGASFNNSTYETEISKAQSIPSVNPTKCTNERKVVNVPPFAHSVELPTKRSGQEATKRSMLNNDVSGDVYNHLHEKEKDPDVDETYDHAHAHAMGESDYSILDPGTMNMEPDVSASDDNDYDVKMPVSDYSSLKKQ